MASKRQTVDLDVTDSLPQTVSIKAGDKTYVVSTDLDPMLYIRIARWYGAYGSAVRGEGELESGELRSLVADVLAIPEDEAAKIGFVGSVRLIAFLTSSLDGLVRRTT